MFYTNRHIVQTSDIVHPQTLYTLHCHPQTLYTLRHCTTSDIVQPQTLYNLRHCTPSDIVQPQTLYNLRHCTPSDIVQPQTLYNLRHCTTSDIVHPQTLYSYLRHCTPSYEVFMMKGSEFASILKIGFSLADFVRVSLCCFVKPILLKSRRNFF